MDLNFLVFRPPNSTYTLKTLGSNLLWVPRDFSSLTIEQQFLLQLQLQNRKSLTPIGRNISHSCCPFIKNENFQNKCLRVSTNATIYQQQCEDIVESEGDEFGGCLQRNIKKYQIDLGFIGKKLEFKKNKLKSETIEEEEKINAPFQNIQRGRKRESQETNYIKNIPCLNLKAPESKYIILFFHSNGEDISQALNLLTFIRIVALEYSGYGIYKQELSADKMKSDALQVYDYLMSFNEDTEIIVFGRSIGTGLACYVAKERKPKALVLMSAFTSIKHIARD